MFSFISKTIVRTLPLVVAAMSFVRCTDEKPADTDAMQVIVSIVSKSDSQVTASFVPYDAALEYRVGIADSKKTVDERVKKGVQTVVFSGLDSETSYTVYARCGDKVVSEVRTRTEAVISDDYVLSLELSEISSDMLRYKLRSTHQDRYYFVDCVKKSVYDTWTEGVVEANQALMRSAVEILRQQGYDVTPSYFLEKGDSEGTVEDLSPGTAYVLFAFGMDEDYTLTAPLVEVEFATEAFRASDPCTFAFSVEDISTDDFVLKVTPSSSETRYYVGVTTYLSAKDYTPDEVANALIAYENKIGSDWNSIPCIKSGEASLSIVKDLGYSALTGSTLHEVYVFGVDGNGRRTTEVAGISVRTADPEPSGLSLKIALKSVTSVGASIDFTPSDDSEAYFTDVMTAEQFDAFASEEELAYYVVDMLDSSINGFLTAGKHNVDCDGMLVSDTEYVAYGFGFSGGVTSGVYAMRFRTNAVTTGSDAALSLDYQVMDGESFGYKGESVLYLQFTPNSSASTWKVFVTTSDLSVYSEKDLLDLLNLKGSSNDDKMAFHLPWETKVNVLMVAYNSKGEAGPVSLKTIVTSRKAATRSLDASSLETPLKSLFETR